MKTLLMISGDRATAQGKRGAFYNTLEEFHKYFDRIDIIVPPIGNGGAEVQLFDNVFIHPSPWSLWLQPFWILQKGYALISKYRMRGMVVHEYPPFYNGLGAFFLKLLTRVPYISEIHHIPGLPRGANLKERCYRMLSRIVLPLEARSAKVFRVVNQTEVPRFLRRIEIPQSKIQYIPSFYIDFNIFKPYDVPKQYDVVFAARLERNKGIFALITAIAIAKKQRPNISLLIIGHGSLREKLEAHIQRLGLTQNVTFSNWLPALEDVAKAYASARIFVNPSLNEGGPRVVIEAMACGVPIITTPVGAMIDLIQDGETGIITDWSSYSIADCIERLLANESLRTKISEAGLSLVAQFERTNAIKHYAQEVSRLLDL